MIIVKKNGVFSAIPIFQRRITVASYITLCRLFLAPFVSFFLIKGLFGIALVLFVIAALTDVIDGAVARYGNQETFLGRWLDALTDRVLIMSSFLSLLKTSFVIPLPRWFLFFVVARELLLLVGACSFYYVHSYFSIEPVMLAKISMALYVITFVWSFISMWYGFADNIITYYIIWITVVCTIISLMQQFLQGVKPMFQSSSKDAYSS